jgi:hypothetical protein
MKKLLFSMHISHRKESPYETAKKNSTKMPADRHSTDPGMRKIPPYRQFSHQSKPQMARYETALTLRGP